MRINFVFVAAFMFSSTCYSHQDTLLNLQSDGTISGVPSKFGTAKLQLAFVGSEKSTTLSGVTLTLGKKKTELPPCITKLLKSRSTQDSQISSSWYHDEIATPYYLDVDFLDYRNPKLKGPRDGSSLIFNLRTGKLMRIERHTAKKSNRSVNGIAILNKGIELKATCLSNEQIALLELPNGSK